MRRIRASVAWRETLPMGTQPGSLIIAIWQCSARRSRQGLHCTALHCTPGWGPSQYVGCRIEFTRNCMELYVFHETLARSSLPFLICRCVSRGIRFDIGLPQQEKVRVKFLVNKSCPLQITLAAYPRYLSIVYTGAVSVYPVVNAGLVPHGTQPPISPP